MPITEFQRRSVWSEDSVSEPGGEVPGATDVWTNVYPKGTMGECSYCLEGPIAPLPGEAPCPTFRLLASAGELGNCKATESATNTENAKSARNDKSDKNNKSAKSDKSAKIGKMY